MNNIPADPKRICIVRLSALGDVILAVPAVRAIRNHFPHADITWVIESRFIPAVEEIKGITFLPIQKPESPGDYFRLWRQFRNEQYDVLLAMQASLRANLMYLLIKSDIKIGFDRRRARDGHSIFIGHSIEREDHHLADGFMSFAKVLGVAIEKPHWNPAVDEGDILWVTENVGQAPFIVIHIAASKKERNWSSSRYIELINFIADSYHCPIVLTGGSSVSERQTADIISRNSRDVLNLAGRTSIKRLMALLKCSSVLISPDSGPVHVARSLHTPVIGLYAVARPELSGPYEQLDYTVNKYEEAVKTISNRDPLSVDWHYRVHSQAAMDLISVQDVIEKLEMIPALNKG